MDWSLYDKDLRHERVNINMDKLVATAYCREGVHLAME